MCKITYIFDNSSPKGTGFFMNISENNSSKYLITNYHVISEILINKYIKLEIHNKEIIKLFLDINARSVNFFKQPFDITIIEIKNDDFEIIKNVEFLNFDYNYLEGYEQYKNIDVFFQGILLEILL